MNALREYVLTLNLINIFTAKDTGIEYIVIQGTMPLSEKEEEKIFYGNCKNVNIFDELCGEYDELCSNCKKIEKIHFQGYFVKDKFYPVNIIGYDYKKEK